MSWSIQKRVGTPEKIREAVATDFDNAAKHYTGKTEEQDVLAAKAAVLSYLDEVQLSPGHGVEVSANGSRGWSLTVNVSCSQVLLST